MHGNNANWMLDYVLHVVIYTDADQRRNSDAGSSKTDGSRDLLRNLRLRIGSSILTLAGAVSRSALRTAQVQFVRIS